jgi:hypothetical protein
MAIKIKLKRATKDLGEDSKFKKPAPESTIIYGRKSSEQGEGIPPQPGTFDRNAIDPSDVEDEFPRQRPKGWDQGHLRSPENKISSRGKVRNLARQIKF